MSLSEPFALIVGLPIAALGVLVTLRERNRQRRA
jgi:hypothetical protein